MCVYVLYFVFSGLIVFLPYRTSSGSSIYGPNLVILPNAVNNDGSLSSLEFTVSVIAMSSDDHQVISDAPGIASIEIGVNRPPDGGSFSVSPLTGSFLDPFTLTCSGWSDSSIVFYQFAAWTDGTEDSEILLNAVDVRSEIEAILPPGEITLVAYILDAVGASRRVILNTTVTVLVPSNDTLECTVQNTMDTVLDQASRLQNFDDTLQLVSSLSLILNNHTIRDSFASDANENSCGVSVNSVCSFRRQLRSTLLDSLLPFVDGSDLSSMDGAQLLSAVTALTVSPREITDESFDKISTLLNETLSILSSSGDIGYEALQLSTQSVFGILSNVLASGNCSRYAEVSSSLINLYGISQSVTVSGENSQVFDSSSISSLLAPVFPEDTSVDFSDISLTVPQAAFEGSGAVVTLTQFNGILGECVQQQFREEIISDTDIDLPDVCASEFGSAALIINPGNTDIISTVVDVTVLGPDGNPITITGLSPANPITVTIPIFPGTTLECGDSGSNSFSYNTACQVIPVFFFFFFFFLKI